MSDMFPNAGLGFTMSASGSGSAQAPEEDTMRHGMMDRAMRHARQREMMHGMVQRHEMHRRMMRRATRQGLDV